MNSLILIFLSIAALVTPAIGGLGLLLGFTLADRYFGLINLSSLINFPIFITEPVLFGLFLHAAYKTIRHRDWNVFELGFTNPWIYFYLVGVFNLISGVYYQPPILVLRDSVIIFYAIIFHLTLYFVRTPQHLKVVFMVVLIGLIARFILQFIFPILSYGTITRGMYSSIIILVGFTFWPHLKKYQIPFGIFSAISVGTILLTNIRTIWISLFFGWLILGLLSYLYKFGKARFLWMGAYMAMGILVTLGSLWIGDRVYFKSVTKEIHTLFMGMDSPNVMTRLAMWTDSLEEVIPWSRPLTKLIDRDIINPKLYGTKNELPDRRLSKADKQLLSLVQAGHHSATGILNEYVQGEEETGLYTPPIKGQIRKKIKPPLTLPPTPLPENLISTTEISEPSHQQDSIKVKNEINDQSKMGSSIEILNPMDNLSKDNPVNTKLPELVPTPSESSVSSPSHMVAQIHHSSDTNETNYISRATNSAISESHQNIDTKIQKEGSHPKEKSKNFFDPIKEAAGGKKFFEDRKDAIIADAIFKSNKKKNEKAVEVTSISKEKKTISITTISEMKKHKIQTEDVEIKERNSITRLLFGVGFGQKFIPSRVSLLHHADRYDPHNSLFAILYRGGVLGLLLFLIITFGEVRKAYKEGKYTQWEWQKLAIAGLICAWSYHFAHSMTDVTIPNPFRGGVYWLVLGLLAAARKMKASDENPHRP